MGVLPSKDYTNTIVTVMKDEAPYMIDWLAYHLSIGFTHFVILTNDCSDGTEKIARKLEKIGLVTHKNNKAPHPKGPQKTGYIRMRNLEAVQNAEWLMALDVDEYLRIDVSNGTLNGLKSYVGTDVKAISFVWQLFGNNNIETISGKPVFHEFTQSQLPLQTRPYETTSIKTLYQNKYFDRIGTHRPIDIDKSQIQDFLWIDADGVPMIPYYLQRHWRAYETGLGFGTLLGRVNHYALRSLDGFMLKWQRGFVHPNAPTVRGKGTPLDYWKLFNWNLYEEPNTIKYQSISAYKDAILSVDNINKLYEQSIEWHQKQANVIKITNGESYRSLKAHTGSKLDDPMPDFSQHGSPKSMDQETIAARRLMLKARQHSIFEEDKLLKHYKKLT